MELLILKLESKEMPIFESFNITQCSKIMFHINKRIIKLNLIKFNKFNKKCLLTLTNIFLYIIMLTIVNKKGEKV